MGKREDERSAIATALHTANQVANHSVESGDRRIDESGGQRAGVVGSQCGSRVTRLGDTCRRTRPARLTARRPTTCGRYPRPEPQVCRCGWRGRIRTFDLLIQSQTTWIALASRSSSSARRLEPSESGSVRRTLPEESCAPPNSFVNQANSVCCAHCTTGRVRAPGTPTINGLLQLDRGPEREALIRTISQWNGPRPPPGVNG